LIVIAEQNSEQKSGPSSTNNYQTGHIRLTLSATTAPPFTLSRFCRSKVLKSKEQLWSFACRCFAQKRPSQRQAKPNNPTFPLQEPQRFFSFFSALGGGAPGSRSDASHGPAAATGATTFAAHPSVSGGTEETGVVGS